MDALRRGVKKKKIHSLEGAKSSDTVHTYEYSSSIMTKSCEHREKKKIHSLEGAKSSDTVHTYEYSSSIMTKSCEHRY
jgi:hypothetical protein